ncbi:glycosyltransferase family 92 domain-containing protein [Ditylenchus destructor]|uniref:Glycosyltransferase family 92 protein n=1 Tax=Ditylenchus destructor TaxID=166010 RepID=A0AAD4N2T0_9BILA|nr:glycosyltransferase family 92 domain-containing protein [Ditylenchus destructor]
MHLHADPEKLRPICTVYDEMDRAKQQVHGKVMRLMDGLNLGDCNLAIYRIICPSLVLPDSAKPKIGLSVRGSAPVHLTVTKADNKRRSLIICPGRMFAFDKWHLLVTALELYRAHWVDLVLVYIHSVDTDIHKLITFYEQDGLVQIRPSLQMPQQVPGMDINPNTETTFLHQLVNFQDCLYEFRESTEFIAFPDWDDLIITHDFRPSFPLMRQAAADNPKTASFLLSRYVAVFPTLGM